MNVRDMLYESDVPAECVNAHLTNHLTTIVACIRQETASEERRAGR